MAAESQSCADGNWLGSQAQRTEAGGPPLQAGDDVPGTEALPEGVPPVKGRCSKAAPPPVPGDCLGARLDGGQVGGA